MEIVKEVNVGLELLGNISVALPVFGVIAFGFAAFLVWKRTSSTHPLMARLWRLFSRDNEGQDAVIGDFLDDQMSLMRLRFTTGVQVRTKGLAHKLIEWVRDNNEDIGNVAACGSYFDLENISLKDRLPKWWQLIFCGVLAYLLILFIIFLVLMSAVNGVGMQMKESGVFFTLSSEYAKPWRSKQGISRAQCLNNETLPANDFSEADSKIICDIFKDEAFSPFLERSLLQQRIMLGFSVPIFTWFFWETFSWLMCGINAHRMRKRLDKKEQETSRDSSEAGTSEAA